MKTLLIVLAILALLGMVVFILMREHKNVDEEVSQPDFDVPEEPDVLEVPEPEVPEEPEEVETEIAVPEDTDEPEPELESEVNIPEHCKPQEDPVDSLSNKYFFNIHKYTTAKNRSIFCVVCNAVIKGSNYKIIVANSYYPYIGSYTKNLCAKIASKYTDAMTVEEFLKTGSTKFDRIGGIIDALPFVY